MLSILKCVMRMTHDR